MSDDALKRLYRATTKKSVDALPYTPDFEQLFTKAKAQSKEALTRAQLYRRLTNMRKRGALRSSARIGHAPNPVSRSKT